MFPAPEGVSRQICSQLVRIMIFDAIFKNILAMSWRSVLLEDETGVLRENHRPVPSH